jgi:hypothetical protein
VVAVLALKTADTNFLQGGLCNVRHSREGANAEDGGLRRRAVDNYCVNTSSAGRLRGVRMTLRPVQDGRAAPRTSQLLRDHFSRFKFPPAQGSPPVKCAERSRRTCPLVGAGYVALRSEKGKAPDFGGL